MLAFIMPMCNHTALSKGVVAAATTTTITATFIIIIIIIIIHCIKLHYDVLCTYESKDGLGLLITILVILLVWNIWNIRLIYLLHVSTFHEVIIRYLPHYKTCGITNMNSYCLKVMY
jgi:hypothetical protein